MKDKIIEINHGAGGRKMDELVHFITSIICKTERTDVIGPLAMDDSAVLPFPHPNLVMTTDSHTVEPIFFPGGNLGDLSIAGTVNDITVMGAQPLYLSLGIVIEEGYTFAELDRICQSIMMQATTTGIRIVCGDTKVMPRGQVSGVITNTAGVGRLVRPQPLSDSAVLEGDVLIVTGSVGDHGASIIAQREGLNLDTDLESDVAPFWPGFMEVVSHPGVHAMKDVTRGGLATAVNEFALKSKIGLVLQEAAIPIREEVQAICDILGLEPLELSCEGKAILAVSSKSSEEVLRLLRATNLGRESAIIGYSTTEHKRVHVTTEIGGTRILIKPFGEPIPRVC